MENLNLLEELARYGEDLYVRSYALTALGNTRLKIVGAILRDGLVSANPLERTAASKALIVLARAEGGRDNPCSCGRRAREFSTRKVKANLYGADTRTVAAPSPREATNYCNKGN